MKDYIPSLILFVIAVVIFYVPEIAAVIVGGALLFFGCLYAYFIHRWKHLQRTSSYEYRDDFERELFRQGPPRFKNMSVTIFRKYYNF